MTRPFPERAERVEGASTTIVDDLLKDFRPPERPKNFRHECPKCHSKKVMTRSAMGGELMFRCREKGCGCTFPIGRLQTPVVDEREMPERLGPTPGPFADASPRELQNFVPSNRLGIPTPRREDD